MKADSTGAARHAGPSPDVVRTALRQILCRVVELERAPVDRAGGEFAEALVAFARRYCRDYYDRVEREHATELVDEVAGVYERVTRDATFSQQDQLAALEKAVRTVFDIDPSVDDLRPLVVSREFIRERRGHSGGPVEAATVAVGRALPRLVQLRRLASSPARAEGRSPPGSDDADRPWARSGRLLKQWRRQIGEDADYQRWWRHRERHLAYADAILRCATTLGYDAATSYLARACALTVVDSPFGDQFDLPSIGARLQEHVEAVVRERPRDWLNARRLPRKFRICAVVRSRQGV